MSFCLYLFHQRQIVGTVFPVQRLHQLAEVLHFLFGQRQFPAPASQGVQVGQECARNKKTLEQYDVRNVSEQMKKIYTELLGD